MRRIGSVFLFVSLFAGSVAAQHVVDPGMSKAQVVARLGKPAVERSAGTSTYLFYSNGIQRTVGMNDIVVLEGDKVVDAIFRSRARSYSGKSSSPAALSAATARKMVPTTATNPLVMPTAASPAPSAASKPLPAAHAQQLDVAKPTPQARSAIRDQQKAASENAAATPVDPKAAVKPDPKVPPVSPVKP